MAPETKVTKTQGKILTTLSDGNPHSVDSLKLHLNDGEDSAEVTVAMHITNLRKILNPKGKDIVCRPINGVWCYRLVRFLNSEE